jgi:hypothetical protein
MNIAEFKRHLRDNPQSRLRFLLPDGGIIPFHAHITEVGRIDKTFIDCGGTVRHLNTCLLQTWVADDTDHRLAPARLADILDRAKDILRGDDLPVEIEFEDRVISQFPVAAADAEDDTLTFALVTKHTDCLAKDICLPKAASCTPGGGCC